MSNSVNSRHRDSSPVLSPPSGWPEAHGLVVRREDALDPDRLVRVLEICLEI